MGQLWGIEKDESGNYATSVHGPLGSHQQADLDAWIAAAPAPKTRCAGPPALGEWVRDRLDEYGSNKFYRGKGAWLPDYGGSN